MNDLYQIAINNQAEIADRYDALHGMIALRHTDPKDYKKMQQKAAYQSKYNQTRGLQGKYKSSVR